MIPISPPTMHQDGTLNVTEPSTFKCFVHPRPNYIFSRSATVSLDNSEMIVIDARGVEVFRSPLAELRLGRGPVYSPAGMPYDMFWGPDESLLRLAFSRTILRTFLVLCGLLLTLGVLGNVARANELFNLAVALCIMVPVFWLAQRSARSHNQAAFEQRLAELEPSFFQRELVPMPHATTGIGRLWLMAFVALYIFIGSALIAMLSSEIYRPNAPTPDPEGASFRISVFILSVLVLAVHCYRHLKPYRPWATAKFGGYQNIVDLVMVPLLLLLTLAVIATGRLITGL